MKFLSMSRFLQQPKHLYTVKLKLQLSAVFKFSQRFRCRAIMRAWAKKTKPFIKKIVFILFILALLIPPLPFIAVPNVATSTSSTLTAYQSSFTPPSQPFILNTSNIPGYNYENVRFFSSSGSALYAYQQIVPWTRWNVYGVESTGYAPVTTIVTVYNSQSVATPAPFQQFIWFNATKMGITTVSGLLNLDFYVGSTRVYAWIENPSNLNNVTAWVRLPNGIPANTVIKITIILNTTIQYPWTGIRGSSYDNGQYVFFFYQTGTSSAGWTISGSAGITNSPPPGSPYSTAFYANSSVGSYMYTQLPSSITPTGSYVIQYYAYTTCLGNLYFFVSSNGAGVMNRLDGRGIPNYIGLAKTYSWTSWNAPVTGITASPKKWYIQSIVVIGGTKVGTFINDGSAELNNLGVVINPINTTYKDGSGWETFSVQGNYIGLVGDGAGSVYITYWTGILVRAYPPNGVMPSEPSQYIQYFPYFQDGLLVVNTINAIAGQYIGWYYTPTSNTLNVTIKVTSFPNHANFPGIVLYSSNIGDLSGDNVIGNFWALLVTFYGNTIWYHPSSSGYQLLYSSLPQPNPNYPFTFTVIFTKNSAGNVAVSQVAINGTYYTVNVNTPFPWSQIGVVGIRGGLNNLFYVSYFAVSPSPYSNMPLVLVGNVESTGWKIYPYFQNGLLVVNSTYASNPAQYIGWYYTPTSNVLNVTIKVTSFPNRNGYPGIALYSPNVGNQPHDSVWGFWALLVSFYNPTVQWKSPSSGWSVVSLSVAPNPNYPFTFTVIFTKNSAGNVAVSQVAINGTYYTVNVNTPFPWSQIGVVGIRGAYYNLFYVSYFSVTQYLSVFSLVTNPQTNSKYSGSTTVTVYPNSIGYSINLMQAPIASPSSQYPIVTLTWSPTSVPYYTVTASAGSIPISLNSTNTVLQSPTTWNVIPGVGAFATVSVNVNYPTIASWVFTSGTFLPWRNEVLITGSSQTISVPLYSLSIYGNKLTANIPIAESRGWKTYPYFQNGLLVVNSTGNGQYIGWYYTPTSNTLNVTIKVESCQIRSFRPGIDLLSPNVGKPGSDLDLGFHALLVEFSGALWYHPPSTFYRGISSGLPQPNPNYPFTFTVIFTKNSAGNVAVSQVAINGTYYTVNVNTPFPWSQIGVVAIRGHDFTLFYVSYFSFNGVNVISPYGVQSFFGYSIYSTPFTITTNSVLINGQSILGKALVTTNGTGFLSAGFVYANVTTNSGVLFFGGTPMSLKPIKLGFTTTVPAGTYIVSLYGAPVSGTAQWYYTSLGYTYAITSGSLTFYGNVSASLTQSYIPTSAPPSSSTPTPSPPSSGGSSVSPSGLSVVYNGSLYITAPVSLNFSLFNNNSYVTVYPLFNSSGLYITTFSPNTSAVVKVKVFNGSTLIKSFDAKVGEVYQLPIPLNSSGNYYVNVTYGNRSIVIPIVSKLYPTIAFNNMLASLGFYGSLLLVLFYSIFAITMFLRNDMKLMGIGSLAYTFFVVPFLANIGAPTPILITTATVAFLIGVIAIWYSNE